MNIAVFLGAKSGKGEIYSQKVIELGKWIAENGHTLIYGGSGVGLMGILAETVKQNEGKIIGVDVNIEYILGHKYDQCDEFYIEKDMLDRKRKMIELADSFVAFPGSLGTLDELSEVISMLKLNLFKKPCFIYNINGFYDPLKQLLQNMCDSEFLSKTDIQNVFFIENLTEINFSLN